MVHYYAYCFWDGVVGFSRLPTAIPNGAKVFAAGEGLAFKRSVYGKCRLADDNRTYLCPGLPEDNLGLFIKWHRLAFPGQSHFIDDVRVP